ncbi:MAG: glycosyltransferase family 8 protein, partial [Chryseobacterium sp.]
MSQQKRISILTVTDNHYLILLAALVKSIESHHVSGEMIDLYIVGDRISARNIEKFNKSFDLSKINIIWCRMKDVIPKDLIMPTDRTSYPLNIYMRLFFPWIVKKEVDRILYLDVDMIVLDDISKLYYSDLGDHIIGAVQDPKIITFDNEWGGIRNYKVLGFDAKTSYFNTGLLLIDVQKWNAAEISQKVVDCISGNISFLNYPDQYG